MHCLWDQLRRSDLEISGLVPETPRVDRQLLAAHTSLQPCCVLRRRVGPEKRWDCKKHQEGQPSQGKAEMSQAHQMGQTNHTEVALMFGRAASQGRQKRLRVIEDPKRRQCEERNMPFLSLPLLFFKAVHDCEETALHKAMASPQPMQEGSTVPHYMLPPAQAGRIYLGSSNVSRDVCTVFEA